MKKRIMPAVILGLFILQACGANQAEMLHGPAQGAQGSITQGLWNAISDTPYSALIQYTGIEVIRPSDEDLEKHIYYARVIETYRGQEFKDISFSLICEKGEGLVNDDKPVVVTLCIGNEGFYWPGPGSEFPGTDEMTRLARKISRHVKSEPPLFSACPYPD